MKVNSIAARAAAHAKSGGAASTCISTPTMPCEKHPGQYVMIWMVCRGPCQRCQGFQMCPCLGPPAVVPDDQDEGGEG